MYCCTAVLLYCCIAVLLCCSAVVLLYCCTTALLGYFQWGGINFLKILWKCRILIENALGLRKSIKISLGYPGGTLVHAGASRCTLIHPDAPRCIPVHPGRRSGTGCMNYIEVILQEKRKIVCLYLWPGRLDIYYFLT